MCDIERSRMPANTTYSRKWIFLLLDFLLHWPGKKIIMDYVFAEGGVMKERNEVLSTLFLILQVGITMMVTFGLCFAIGFLLDKNLGTRLLWVFIVLGILSGYRAVYLLIRHHIKGKAFEKEKPDWYDKAFAADNEADAGLTAAEGKKEGEPDEEDPDPDDTYQA